MKAGAFISHAFLCKSRQDYNAFYTSLLMYRGGEGAGVISILLSEENGVRLVGSCSENGMKLFWYQITNIRCILELAYFHVR